MLNFVPFAGAGWEMRDPDLKTQIERQLLQGDLPQATSAAIAAAAVGCNQQVVSLGIAQTTHLAPPTADSFGGEAGRVVVYADADPPLVARNVVDAIRNGLAQLLVQKVVNPDFLWFALGLPFAAAVFEIAYQFLFLGVHRDHRLTAHLKGTHQAVNAGLTNLLFNKVFELAGVIGTDALHEFGSGKGTRRFDDGAFAVYPLRFNRVQPRTLAG